MDKLLNKILIVSIITLILCAAYSIVKADELPTEMYMANSAGGYVVLTTEPCVAESVKKDYPYRAYATESSDIVKHEGCWSSPDTSEVPTSVFSKSEGAPEAPTLHVIQMVSTWWKEGGYASFLQSHFTPEKKRVVGNP